jgi:hypothetical protein
MRSVSRVQAVVVMTAIVLLAASSVHAQQRITAAMARAGGVTPGDAPGYPVTLSVPGSYFLAGHLMTPAACDSHAIEITARGVTLDLNGFSIVGPNTACSDGVRATAWFATVVNGTIRGFRTGIALTSWNNRIAGLQVYSNQSTGVSVGPYSVVQDTVAENNAQIGISAESGSLLQRNTVAFSRQGIVVGPASTVLNNTARENSVVGLSLADVSSGYAHNVLTNNANAGPQVLGGSQIGPNVCNDGLCP